jgi:tyrosine-protein phosphatase SIW14
MPPVRFWRRLRPLALITLAVPIWAMSLDAPDVSNFHQVDDHVYRGAQPTAEGWKELAKLGIQVVVDLRPDGELREHWTRSEREAVAAAGMRYISVPMNGWAKPDSSRVVRALAELESSHRVFVHCRAGKDRTGTVIACYRITHNHWTNERALEEARSDGMNPLETAMQQYILDFHPVSHALEMASTPQAR